MVLVVEIHFFRRSVAVGGDDRSKEGRGTLLLRWRSAYSGKVHSINNPVRSANNIAVCCIGFFFQDDSVPLFERMQQLDAEEERSRKEGTQ